MINEVCLLISELGMEHGREHVASVTISNKTELSGLAIQLTEAQAFKLSYAL